MFDLRWGKHLPTLRKAAERGRKTPLDEMPELYPSIEPYYEDFIFLQPYHPPEGGPIPLNEIRAYLDIRGIVDPDERTDFMKIIRDMDMEYLDFQQSQHESSGSAEED